jgi:uncharacterized repeat protein (TIGR01451 family)
MMRMSSYSKVLLVIGMVAAAFILQPMPDSSALVIDDFGVNQVGGGLPCPAGGVPPNAAPTPIHDSLNTASVVGSWRNIDATLSTCSSNSMSTVVDSGFFSFNVGSTVTGSGSITYSGSNNNATFFAPVNFGAGNTISITWITCDHFTDFYLDLYTDATHASTALFSAVGTLVPLTLSKTLNFTDFNLHPTGITLDCDFSNITKVVLRWTGQPELDFSIDQIVKTEAGQPECLDKTIEGVKHVTFDGTPWTTPVDVLVSVRNVPLATEAIRMLIQDKLTPGAGWAYRSGSTVFSCTSPVTPCPASTEPVVDNVNHTITWDSGATTAIAPGQHLTIAFQLDLDPVTFLPGVVHSDCVSVKLATDPNPFPTCSDTGPCYADITLAEEPSLLCVNKQFDKTAISDPNGTLTVTGSIRNNGNVPITDLKIKDVMQTKMTYAGGSNIGVPVEGPVGTWTFSGHPGLAVGATLNYTFQVTVTGLNVNETVCDTVHATSAEFGLDSFANCTACVTRRTTVVPAMNTVGLVALLLVVATGGVLLLRRRQRA